jgi:tRNA pseudouridine55 synthase
MPAAVHERIMEAEGFLTVDKPAGITSHDAVQVVKRCLGVRKAGHLGTLDPMATGVLVVCIGAATKAAPFLASHMKEYEGTMVLGAQTDTWDAEGKITAQQDSSSVTEEMIRETFSGMLGEMKLAAPAYSAIKQHGKPLYKKARNGEAVNPPVRNAKIYKLDFLSYESPGIRFKCAVSAGTYVRSLAMEAGRRLGVGAYLGNLRRTRSGPYTIEDAISLTKLESASDISLILEKLIPLRSALAEMPELSLDWETAARVQNGQFISERDLKSGDVQLMKGEAAELVKAVNPAGEVVSVMKQSDGRIGAREWKPVRVWKRVAHDF